MQYSKKMADPQQCFSPCLTFAFWLPHPIPQVALGVTSPWSLPSIPELRWVPVVCRRHSALLEHQLCVALDTCSFSVNASICFGTVHGTRPWEHERAAVPSEGGSLHGSLSHMQRSGGEWQTVSASGVRTPRPLDSFIRWFWRAIKEKKNASNF